VPLARANGIELAYEALGDPQGDPVLLIAGLGLQLISWPDAFCDSLASQGLRLIRFDNRDSGLSTKMEQFGRPDLRAAFVRSVFRMPLASAYTLHDMADDAVGLLDALHLERAHLVGVSMGGMIAQIIAALHPQRTASLTSIMSTSGRAGLPGPTLAASNALFSKPRNPRDIDSVTEHLMRVARVLGSPRYPTPDALLRERVIASVRRNVCLRGTARQIMAVAASGDRVALLRTIRARTLVIHGTADPLVPVAGGRDTSYLVPGAVLREIDGMGHDLPPALEIPLAQLIGAHCKGEALPRVVQT
jgi:proline iminopeptidase